MSRSPGGRRPSDLLKTPEAAFRKAATKPIEEPPKAPSYSEQETVTIRIDRDVLGYFQEDGPGWQDRTNAALREAAGK